MTTRSGSAQAALDFLNPHIGLWSYDHNAGWNTRFGPITPRCLFPTKSSIKMSDCSGALIRAAIEGGMTRYEAGIPESSGDMARWADKHPEQLLWSIYGGGRYATLAEAILAAPKFAWFVIGGYNNGDAGHVVAKWDDQHTVESSSGLKGLRIGTFSRFTGRHAITHAFLPPMNFGAINVPPPSPTAWVPNIEENEMNRIQRIWYAQQKQLHSFWIDDNQMQHTWEGDNGIAGYENLTKKLGLQEALNPDVPINVAVAPNGDMLVGALAADGALIEFRWSLKLWVWAVKANR